MKRRVFPVITSTVAVLVFVGAVALMAHAQQAQLSASKSQTGREPTKVAMDTVDFASGIDHPNATDVVIKHSGVYFIMVAAQVGSTSGTGYVDLFIRVNGKDLPNSNTRQSIVSADDTGVLVSQAVSPLKPGDVVNAVFTASDPSLGVIAIQPDDEPLIPAVIFSIFRFGG